MKQLFLGIAFILLAITATAQQGRNRGRAMERIHAAKVAYVVDRLQITADQMAGFIAVYNEYDAEKTKCRKEAMGKYKGINPNDTDNSTALQFVEDDLDYQQKVINIKRSYNDKFLKVISAKQLAELSPAEREFRMLLMDRLKKRRDQGKSNGKW